MSAADRQMKADGVKPADLGLSDSMMGMDMDSTELSNTKEFDRMFIEMMIPHHEGAIRMSRVEIARGKDPQLRELARTIVAAQSREVRQMKRWRAAWYRGGDPSGGSMEMDKEMEDHSGMNHSGM